MMIVWRSGERLRQNLSQFGPQEDYRVGRQTWPSKLV